LEEKFCILKDIDKDNLLNKRSEIFGKCRHKNRFRVNKVVNKIFHFTRGECNGTRSIALLGNGIFYSISRDHKQPIKRLEFNKVLYKYIYIYV
jgi:hypothetical protein